MPAGYLSWPAWHVKLAQMGKPIAGNVLPHNLATTHERDFAGADPLTGNQYRQHGVLISKRRGAHFKRFGVAYRASRRRPKSLSLQYRRVCAALSHSRRRGVKWAASNESKRL